MLTGPHVYCRIRTIDNTTIASADAISEGGTVGPSALSSFLLCPSPRPTRIKQFQTEYAQASLEGMPLLGHDQRLVAS